MSRFLVNDFCTFCSNFEQNPSKLVPGGVTFRELGKYLVEVLVTNRDVNNEILFAGPHDLTPYPRFCKIRQMTK